MDLYTNIYDGDRFNELRSLSIELMKNKDINYISLNNDYQINTLGWYLYNLKNSIYKDNDNSLIFLLIDNIKDLLFLPLNQRNDYYSTITILCRDKVKYSLNLKNKLKDISNILNFRGTYKFCNLYDNNFYEPILYLVELDELDYYNINTEVYISKLEFLISVIKVSIIVILIILIFFMIRLKINHII